MNDKTKSIALTVSGAALALAMGIQTFVFGKNDMQSLKDEVAALSQKVKVLKDCCGR